METIFWCTSSHTVEPSQASVTTTTTTMAATPHKVTKRNANRYKKSYRAHRGPPRYYVQGVLVAHCHRCNVTHPMGQHLPSIMTKLTQSAIGKSSSHTPPARPNLNPLEQERIQVLLHRQPDYQESLGNVPQPVTTSQQQSPNSKQGLFHLPTQLDKGTQTTEIKKRFKRNSARRRRKDGSRIYRGPGPTPERPTAHTGSS